MTALDGPTRAAGGATPPPQRRRPLRELGGLTSNASVKPGSVVAGGRSRAIADTSHGGQPGRSAPRWAPTAATDGGSTCTTVQKRAVRRVGGPGPEASAGGVRPVGGCHFSPPPRPHYRRRRRRCHPHRQPRR
ncbi:hypothetical protein BU14_0485s0002 [Porphyra umbilicalis]|uniref:Uncharacterized protein n=1 Tax=Porphyra umbilicalis TaxID=2786 RepID=A0A1X6NTM3_PORUM|nr:hypothetical protein BU14_0485s0002 [Porphyra umbilicalis]|eukprot:OSX71962.1 hypothetical protein BU14_0485s0002 [Porphyra umbilicalis]